MHHYLIFLFIPLFIALLPEAKANELPCTSDGAPSTCIKANKPAEYYIKQSELYFRTMESNVAPWVQPNYAAKVLRWEWPPWLWLTGYSRWNLIWTDTLLKLFPTAYSKLDCRFFETQPFGRCHVVFDYSGHLCPIYEEFTFNQDGEITFIEAWTDYPVYLPMKENDHWAETEDVKRLSTKVPGLGKAHNNIGITLEELEGYESSDDDIKNLNKRLKSPYLSYFQALKSDETDIKNGCQPLNERSNER